MQATVKYLNQRKLWYTCIVGVWGKPVAYVQYMYYKAINPTTRVPQPHPSPYARWRIYLTKAAHACTVVAHKAPSKPTKLSVFSYTNRAAKLLLLSCNNPSAVSDLDSSKIMASSTGAEQLFQLQELTELKVKKFLEPDSLQSIWRMSLSGLDDGNANCPWDKYDEV